MESKTMGANIGFTPIMYTYKHIKIDNGIVYRYCHVQYP